MLNDDIDKLIKMFHEKNGNANYSQRDLLKYIISKLDILDDKIDNHISHSLERISKLETTMSNSKWILGFIITGIVSLIVAIVIIMMSGII